MKIGIVNYAGTSLLDMAGLLKTFSIAKQFNPDVRFNFKVVSYQVTENHDKNIFIQPDQVGEVLTDFDIIVLPGREDVHQEDLDFPWITWLKSTRSGARYYGFNHGNDLLGYLKLENHWMQSEYNPLYGFFVGLEILSQSLSWSAVNQIAKELKFLSEWSSFQLERTPRVARITRKTAETEINLELGLDSVGKSKINTGIPFLDHMVNQISKHGLFDLELVAKGDLEVDDHHTMEDCGIILGDAFRLALGDKKGINRMASATIPMDESLATVTIDFSARPYFVIQSKWTGEAISDIPVSLFEHFLESFAMAARANIFIQVHAGKDNHHMIEAIFKALARALYQACKVDERRKGQIPSTKEMLV